MTRRRFKPEDFQVVMSDKRVAQCHRTVHQDYSNCRISAGIVEELPPEDCFFMFERPPEKPTIFMLRRDEMAATAWVITGALWTDAMEMLRVKEDADKSARKGKK